MKTERNQLASVGQRRIWSLPAALLEKEDFQPARFFRDGTAGPLLNKGTPLFHSTTTMTGRVEENRGSDVIFVRNRHVAKASAASCNLLHKSDVCHRPWESAGSTMLGA
jgi:hypothetical protein